MGRKHYDEDGRNSVFFMKYRGFIKMNYQKTQIMNF